MKLSPQHHINPQFSLSSMTDVVFLLLIFFMLTMSSVTPQALLIDLPVSSHSNAPLAQVSVMITADLRYYVDHEPIEHTQLESLLQQKLSQDQRVVLLHIDKSVPVAYVVEITDIAASLDTKVAIVTQPD